MMITNERERVMNAQLDAEAREEEYKDMLFGWVAEQEKDVDKVEAFLEVFEDTDKYYMAEGDTFESKKREVQDAYINWKFGE